MMKKEVIFKSDRKGAEDPQYSYILLVACLIFLYLSFRHFARGLYEQGLIIPCLLFWGGMKECGRGRENKKNFILPGVMVVWFVFLQIKRTVEQADLNNVGLFFTTYLFAFPLASMLRDGDEKKALKIFAGAYMAAAAVLSVEGLLLVFEFLPGFLSKYVFWDGDRLNAFWHPNITACLLMIGVVFSITFCNQVKCLWAKIGFCVLVCLMVFAIALTNCRTAVILTGGYLGVTLFFVLIKRGKKWFFLGVLAIFILTMTFYWGTKCLYQKNHNILIDKYLQQYSEQIISESATNSISEEIFIEEAAEQEETYDKESYSEVRDNERDYAESPEERIPIVLDRDTGEIYLTKNSQQGSIESDFGTLNSRTYIWNAAWFAIRETPEILYWGMPNPGWYVSYYNFFPVAHLHNAWMECLVGMGLVGFLIAVLITGLTIWNCLIILLKHYRDIWKRNVALLTLCLMIAAMLEPYLFYTTIDYHLIDFLFFLCAGYLAHWQEVDNRYIVDSICRNISFVKNNIQKW